MNKKEAFNEAISTILEDLGYLIYEEKAPKTCFKVVLPSGGVLERIEFDE